MIFRQDLSSDPENKQDTCFQGSPIKGKSMSSWLRPMLYGGLWAAVCSSTPLWAQSNLVLHAQLITPINATALGYHAGLAYQWPSGWMAGGGWVYLPEYAYTDQDQNVQVDLSYAQFFLSDQIALTEALSLQPTVYTTLNPSELRTQGQQRIPAWAIGYRFGIAAHYALSPSWGVQLGYDYHSGFVGDDAGDTLGAGLTLRWPLQRSSTPSLPSAQSLRPQPAAVSIEADLDDTPIILPPTPAESVEMDSPAVSRPLDLAPTEPERLKPFVASVASQEQTQSTVPETTSATSVALAPHPLNAPSAIADPQPALPAEYVYIQAGVFKQAQSLQSVYQRYRQQALDIPVFHYFDPQLSAYRWVFGPFDPPEQAQAALARVQQQLNIPGSFVFVSTEPLHDRAKP